MVETTSLLPTSEVQGECRAELARALLSRRLHSQFHIAKIQKIIEKTKHFPDYFLTKSTAHKRRNGSRDDFRFSILIFWGTCTHTQVPDPMTNVTLFNFDGERGCGSGLGVESQLELIGSCAIVFLDGICESLIYSFLDLGKLGFGSARAIS